MRLRKEGETGIDIIIKIYTCLITLMSISGFVK